MPHSRDLCHTFAAHAQPNLYHHRGHRPMVHDSMKYVQLNERRRPRKDCLMKHGDGSNCDSTCPHYSFMTENLASLVVTLAISWILATI